MAELAPGSTFADHVILDLAGRGGMGVVYHALHEPLDRHVALKLIAPEWSADSVFRSRFQRECKAAASIHHPNVVPIYHAGEEQGLLFVSMQYIEGADLGRVLALEERLEWARAATLVADIAGGIDAAHQLGIVHRDVKPANVLIESRATGMHPFLTDFGLAKCVTSSSQMTHTGAILGTLDYAAPEQLEESEVDGRTDVYALGCVLFHALTGRVPYPRDTNAGKILAHLQSAPPSVTFLAPDVPEPLASVVQRAMCKDPEDRYPSAGELGRAALAAVEAVAAGTPAANDTGTVTITTGTPARSAHPAHPARSAHPARVVRARDGAFPPALALDDRDTRFVGRRELIDRLAHRYALADAGRRQFVVLSGEPGAGKTRVAAEFARRAFAEPATVLYGRSDAESIVPYQPFITAIGQYFAHHDTSALAAELDLELGELGRFIPSLRRSVPALVEPLAVEPDARRFRLFDAVTRVLEFIAAERPVVLILDDLHWADTSTALLLRHVVQQLHDVRLLLLGTLRDVEACRADDLVQLLARLGAESSFERILVPGLDARETADLVVAHDIGAPTEGFVRSLRRATDGNPLFINETLKSLSETASPSSPGVVSESTLERVGVPEVAQEMIAQRIARLEDTTRKVLSVAAIVGTSFHLRVLEALLAEPADAIIDALEEASTAGLIREADDDVDRFGFSHALVRDALCAQHSSARRIRVHHRIGEALEQVGSRTTSPAELAHHFFASRHLDGGRKALVYSVQAGDAAARALAHAEAIEHYRRALAALDMSAPDDEQQRCEVLLALAEAELRQGDPAARRNFQEAAELARRGGMAELLGRAALGIAGRHAEAGIVDREAIAVLEEALERLGEEDRSALRAQLMAGLADALQFAQEPARTAALSHEALVLAREIGDTHTLVATLESRHTALLHIEHLDERLRLSDEFLSLAESVDARELKAIGLHWRIFDLLEAGDVAGARRAHRGLAALADELRQPLYHHFALGWEVVWAQMEGRSADSERLAGEAFELGTQAQARDAETVHAIQVIALRRRADMLSDSVSTIEDAIDKHPSLVAWRAVLPLANLAAGNLPEALAQFERLAQDDFARVPRDMFWFTAVCVLSEACAHIGDRERAERLYELLLPFKDRNVQVTQAAFWGSAERFLGLLAAALGRWDAAFEHVRSAIAKNEANGCPVAAAVVRRDYAEMLLARRAPGDYDTGVAILREVLEGAKAAGMSVVTTHLQARLDELV